MLLNREFLEIKYGKARLKELTEIDLNSYEIKAIDSNTFKGLKKLEKLSLSQNEIGELDEELFEDVRNLKELHLSFNRLERIGSDVFKGLFKLKKLSLHMNRLTEIDVNAFESLKSLECLYLDNNNLGKIDRNCFEPLRSIEVLQIFDSNLNALSFLTTPTQCFYDKHKLNKIGFKSDWKEFLDQFPGEPAPIIDALDTNIGRTFNDRYKIVGILGKGAYGIVYLVDDIQMEDRKMREKAMKVMDKLSPSTVIELNLLFDIHHQNIVKYFDHFHMEVQTFLITEYCKNGDLKKRIERVKDENREFSEDEILKWMCQATSALNYLHSKTPRAIIHRDIKPANMLLNKRDDIKIVDLGVSKLMTETHASTYEGTPAYMSPEMFRSQIDDVEYYPNTDIWSLGCVLYELIFLEIAFPRGQRGNPPLPLNLYSSDRFSGILSKMLEKNYLERITSNRLLIELEKL